MIERSVRGASVVCVQIPCTSPKTWNPSSPSNQAKQTNRFPSSVTLSHSILHLLFLLFSFSFFVSDPFSNFSTSLLLKLSFDSFLMLFFLSFPLHPSFSQSGKAVWPREQRSGKDDESAKGERREGTDLNSQADSMPHLVPGPRCAPGFVCVCVREPWQPFWAAGPSPPLCRPLHGSF